MTCRGGREASERSSGIGEVERQPVMARLAAKWRRSNLVKLAALRKGNHPGEAREGAEEKIYTEERGTPWRGPMKKQRYSLRL